MIVPAFCRKRSAVAALGPETVIVSAARSCPRLNPADWVNKSKSAVSATPNELALVVRAETITVPVPSLTVVVAPVGASPFRTRLPPLGTV